MAMEPGMKPAGPPAPGAPMMPPEAEGAAPDMAGGYCIEIYVTPDGKMSVAVEPKMAEESAPGEEAAQPVANIGEAMRLVREIVANAGEMTDMGAGQDEMGAGYGSNT